MTNAEQLIRQAIRELHIDIAPYDRAVEISAEAGYAVVYDLIRKAWLHRNA